LARQETAALRDFDVAYDRLGSFSDITALQQQSPVHPEVPPGMWLEFARPDLRRSEAIW